MLPVHGSGMLNISRVPGACSELKSPEDGDAASHTVYEHWFSILRITSDCPPEKGNKKKKIQN